MLKWEVILDNTGGPNAVREVTAFKEGVRRVRVSTGNVRREAGLGERLGDATVMTWKMEEGGQPAAGRGKEMDSSLEPPEGGAAAHTLVGPHAGLLISTGNEFLVF